MNKETVRALALTNGFKLKEQPDGEMELNPYVYDFANAIAINQLTTVREAIQPDGLINSDAGIKTINAITNSINKHIEFISK